MPYRTLLLLAFLAAQHLQAQQTISEKQLRKNVEYLADDKLKGRGTGTDDEIKAAKRIAKEFKKIGLKPKGDNGDYYHVFGFKKSSDPHGSTDAASPQLYGRNVAGFLDNSAPYTIVIGAHFDHLGLGDQGGSLEANSVGQIHNGADDNASGTAGMIEMARYFANNGVKENHNFLFLAFSAEELGLIGSKKYTENPTIDLSTVSFMLNMDMIGRLNEQKSLVVGGVGTAPDFVPIFNNLKGDFKMKLDSAGIGPSDHTSFYLKNIPVLFFFTGQHKDYHKPSDDADKVNYAGIIEVLNLGIKAITQLDKTPKLTFQETKSNQTNNTSFKVTLGIMPDYAFDGEGVHVDGVTDGRPAAGAGVKKGDVITGLGDLPVKSMQDYMKALGAFNKGDTTTVTVVRGAETLKMPITF